MYRASLPGYQVALFQLCPFPEALDHILTLIDSVQVKKTAKILNELVQWWIYLFVNYGVHCQRSSIMNKKVIIK